MAEIISSGGGRTHTVARHIKIDMTPLVDLAFLLITFFIFTTSMSDGKAMNLFMPKDGPPVTPAASSSISFLLAGNNRVFFYEGLWNEAKAAGSVQQTGYSTRKGIGAAIRAKQAALRSAGKKATDLMVIIKPANESSYRNTVDAFDEILINGVTRYAIMDADAEESGFLAAR